MAENVKFNASVLAVRKLFQRTEKLFIFIDAETNFKLANYTYTPEGVLNVIKDNVLDATKMTDVYYAAVLLFLATTSVIDASPGTPRTTLTPQEIKLISPQSLSEAENLSKIILRGVLHSYYKGSAECDLEWYTSHVQTNVAGRFISEPRLIEIYNGIVGDGKVSKIMDLLTVGDIKDRFPNWLSTPSWIKKAMEEMVKIDPVLIKWFEPEALDAYKSFYRGGLAAQIASSPLKVYCSGNVDPLKVSTYSDSLKLSELACIQDPYHEPTIRRARIILETVGYPFGKWYQGNKAMRGKTPFDDVFRAKVEKAYKEMLSNKGEKSNT